MERIVFLERDTFKAIFRRPSFAHDWQEYASTSPGETVARLLDATIAICNKVRLGEEELSRLPRLRFIAVAATGVDNVELDYCREHGISVSNVRDYARHSVPEHVFALILALRRNLIAYRQDLRDGAWQRAEQFCLLNHPIRDLNASTLGVIGYGALGQSVGRLAEAFGMRLLVSEHKGARTIRQGRVSFEEVLRGSDVVSLHCPLTDETRNMIGAPELESMREDALLINTARGGLVSESALVQTLLSGKIAGAGFDVLTSEPPTEGNPLLKLDVPNFILTPHVAWASQGAMQALADQVILNIEAFVTGAPLNLVT
ncbi:MAG TPA: D-2-hydroxyacid dehydrogenase [Pyrinomonadaceae bacterium]|jgi:glycerate dehydrogenase|nr:D-2-hydroxyacid dehydrogenase [Pyrinomonadaceae bacterium]